LRRCFLASLKRNSTYLRHVDGADGQRLESDEDGPILVPFPALEHHVEPIASAFDEMRILKGEGQLKLGVQDPAAVVRIWVRRNLEKEDIPVKSAQPFKEFHKHIGTASF
jgi:hypothetical protein